MEPKGEENLSLDNWHKKTDDILASTLGTDPLEWFRSWSSLGLVSLFIMPISLLTTRFIGESDIFEMTFQFGFFSILPALISWLSYAKVKSTIHNETKTEQHQKVSNTFLAVGMTGLIILFFMSIYISISRLDCGLGCVKPVWVDTISAGLFFILWILLPFYFWWKAKKLVV